MNKATRPYKVIASDTIEVVCRDPDRIQALRYSAGSLVELEKECVEIDNGMFKCVVQTLEDGYYFVKSRRNIQSLKKGNVQSRVFLYDAMERPDVDLSPESFDSSGVSIGTNDYSYIGAGIYEITPLTLGKSVILVAGNMYYSNPSEEMATDCNTQIAASVPSMTIGGSSSILTVNSDEIDAEASSSSVGIRVSQTVFSV